MDSVIIFGFKAVAWTFIALGHCILPLFAGSAIFLLWARFQELRWAFSWKAEHKKRKKAGKPKPKPKPPSKTPRPAVSTYSDEYKLPQHPFS